MQPLACYNHPDRTASATCADCGAPVCADCTNMLRGQPFCPADYALMRREPAGAHLPVEVPAYQPPQYQQAQPALTTSAPLVSSSLLGSELVAVASAPLRSVAQRRIPPDAIQKWAQVGFACALLSLADIVAIILLITTQLMPLLEGIGLLMGYLVIGFAGVGLIINIVTLALAPRSNNTDRVDALGCSGLVLNGFILGIIGLGIWVLSNIRI